MEVLDFFKRNPGFLVALLLIIFSLLTRFTNNETLRIIFMRFVVGGFFLIIALYIFKEFLIDEPNPFYIWNIAATVFGLGMTLVGLLFLFPNLQKYFPKPKPKKCKVCGQPAWDVLVISGNKREGIYCRDHVMEKFKENFLSFTYKMVVFHPEQERKYCGTMYPFYPTVDMVSQFSFQKEDAEVVNKYLSIINGVCFECKDKKSQVAYFAKGVLDWDGGGPLIKEVITQPELLCTKCAFGKIEVDLRNNKEYFSDNGLIAPYKDEGVFINTYL